MRRWGGSVPGKEVELRGVVESIGSRELWEGHPVSNHPPPPPMHMYHISEEPSCYQVTIR